MSESWLEEWRVGDVRVLRVVENEVAIPPSMMFGDAELPSADLHDWLRPHYATPDGRLMFSIHAFLVDDGAHRTIVDTCIGNDKRRANPFFDGLTGPFLDRLASAGYAAETIDRVLCTHLHVDHVGWNTRLVDGAWVPTFPNARYLIAESEWAHASAEVTDPGDDHIGDSIRPVLDAGLVDLVMSDHRISAAVTLEPTPGHTPGHVSIRISSGGEEAVITGDLIHHPMQVVDPDLAPGGLDSDAAHARRTRRAFLTAHADRPVLVLGSHFARPAGGRVISTATGLAFVPPER